MRTVEHSPCCQAKLDFFQGQYSCENCGFTYSPSEFIQEKRQTHVNSELDTNRYLKRIELRTQEFQKQSHKKRKQ